LLELVLTAAIAVASLALVAVGWRVASRRWPRPCPAQLAWVLENPFMDRVAGSATLLDRADVHPGMRVLDAGCGPGRIAIPAADRVGPAGEVVALDIQEGMLARVRAKIAARGITNIRTVLGSLDATTVEADAFDRAFLVTVLGEVPDRARAMRTLYAALRRDGVLSVTEVIPDPDYLTRATVQALGEAAGFQIDRTYTSPLAFTMNFRKQV
jgi:ubiquinone/menaquinone biosynthesis C-methylase UbiE